MANVNQGHRERLRQRMMKEGLQSFQDHEVLELLLFQYLPRKDTNKIAHDLLDKFGSFANVLNASPQQLQQVKGISQVTACNIALLKEVFLRYRASDAEKMSLAGIASVIKYSQKIIADSYVEKTVVVYVDGATNFITSEVFTSNSAQEVKLDLKKIVASAVGANASGVLLFHCHVGGMCLPSEADISFTEKMYVTLANLNIVLLEHIIFNNKGDYYSFFKEKVMSDIANRYKTGKGRE